MSYTTRQLQTLSLLDQLRQLRTDVANEGAAQFARWQPQFQRRDVCSGAHNLACYLALRRRDLRALQMALIPWGLSSLGRSEAHVLASLDALIATLSLMTAQPTPPPHPPMHRFQRGERALARQIDTVFGTATHNRRVRIMVTLPSEAADDDGKLVSTLIQHGMDVARINCAHDNPDVWGRMIAHIKRAEANTGFRCRIHMDLAGPKARTGAMILLDKGRVYVGDHILLTGETPIPLSPPMIQVQSLLPEAVQQTAVGHRVWIDDGKIGTLVEQKLPAGALLRVTHAEPDGGKLRPEKGLNFPDSDLQLNPLTTDDLGTLDFVAQHADLIGYSFVQSGNDVALLQHELARRVAPERAQQIALIAKIETQRAVRNLPDIFAQAAGVQPFGVMIARGDLAVEIGYERMAEMQEELLWLCEAAHVPIIWATQVLEQAVKKGRPARAEITDAAMSARADCVMLNKGAFVAHAVTLLDDVLRRMQAHQIKKRAQLRALHSWG
jgi:pyruvate kinase